ncbi:MAG: LCP family protein [Candidatus Eremiobacteraeota bacterium]|nr:LCP family protein [Candidatus Eremiobacteraeota bacterium]
MADLDNLTPGTDAVGAQMGSGEPALPGRRFQRRYPVIALILLLLVAAFGYVTYKGGVGNALAPFLPSPDLVQVFGRPNLRVLVMGLDENWTTTDEAYTSVSRTDTLLAVNVDLSNKQISVLSIPRDLWVYIPKSGYGKINESYADGGPQRVEAAVVKNLGTPAFDYYVVLRLDATKNIIDALGGLDVDVEKDMDYDDSWGHLHIHLKKGLHHLTGEQAVGYIRFRHDPEGDIGRMRRQRQVVQLLAKRMRDPSIAMHLPALLGVIRDNVRTDMPFGKLYDLALGMRGVSSQSVHSTLLPVEVGWTNGESVLFAKSDARKTIHTYLVAGYGNGFDPSTVHVRVENGSGTPGAASAVADFLRQRGFNVVETANAKSFNNKKTTIESADGKMAGEVARELPVKNPQIALRAVDGVDVVIVIGRDYRIQ